jgi:hypothetical protein
VLSMPKCWLLKYSEELSRWGNGKGEEDRLIGGKRILMPGREYGKMKVKEDREQLWKLKRSQLRFLSKKKEKLCFSKLTIYFHTFVDDRQNTISPSSFCTFDTSSQSTTL